MKRTFQANPGGGKGYEVCRSWWPCDYNIAEGTGLRAEASSVHSSVGYRKSGQEPHPERFGDPMTLHVPRQGTKHRTGGSVACKGPFGSPEAIQPHARHRHMMPSPAEWHKQINEAGAQSISSLAQLLAASW